MAAPKTAQQLADEQLAHESEVTVDPNAPLPAHVLAELERRMDETDRHPERLIPAEVALVELDAMIARLPR